MNQAFIARLKDKVDVEFDIKEVSARISGENRKTVVMLGTGGTIAGSGAKGRVAGYIPGGIDLNELCSSVYGLEELADIIGIQICSTDSNNVTDREWLRMAKIINSLSALEEIAGFVITHGTNTIEETAYFLHLTVKTDKPVILTGSMRPASAISPDGPMNLYQAVSLAASAEGMRKGVMVVFSDAIYSARDVQKVSTFQTDAFSSRDFGCLGYMKEEVPHFYQIPLKAHTMQTEFDIAHMTSLPKVAIAYFHCDADAALLDYMAEHYEGIVIAGCGIGSYSESWRNKVRDLEEKNVPVVRSSRVANGIIIRHKIIEKSNNVIPADTLSPQKSKILLQLGLTKTRDFEELRRMFGIY